MSNRAILILANPQAGGGRARPAALALQRELQRRELHAEVHFTAARGDATARAAAAGAEPWNALVAVGGDGTVREVLNGMPDPTRPLAMLPCGTANVLAHELRLPRRPDRLAELIAAGRTRAHAFGEVQGGRFLLFCGIGLDGSIVHAMEQAPGRVRGKLKWLRPTLATLRRWPMADLSATLDGGERFDGLSTVLVTRVRNYGGVGRLPDGTGAQDPRLHVLMFRARTRRRWLWLGLRALCGGMPLGDDVLLRHASRVQVDGRAPFQVDGDLGGESPVQIELGSVPARLFAP